MASQTSSSHSSLAPFAPAGYSPAKFYSSPSRGGGFPSGVISSSGNGVYPVATLSSGQILYSDGSTRNPPSQVQASFAAAAPKVATAAIAKQKEVENKILLASSGPAKDASGKITPAGYARLQLSRIQQNTPFVVQRALTSLRAQEVAAGRAAVSRGGGSSVALSPVKNIFSGVNPYKASDVSRVSRLLEQRIAAGVATQQEVNRFNLLVGLHNRLSAKAAPARYSAGVEALLRLRAEENVNLKQLREQTLPVEFGGKANSFQQAALGGAELALKIGRKGTSASGQKYLTALKEQAPIVYEGGKLAVRTAGASLGLVGRGIQFIGDSLSFSTIQAAQKLGIKKLDVPVSPEALLAIRLLQKPDYFGVGPIVLTRNPFKLVRVGGSSVVVPQKALGDAAGFGSDVFYLLGNAGKARETALVKLDSRGRVTQVVGKLPVKPVVKKLSVPELRALKYRVGKSLQGVSSPRLPEIDIQLPRVVRTAFGEVIREVKLGNKFEGLSTSKVLKNLAARKIETAFKPLSSAIDTRITPTISGLRSLTGGLPASDFFSIKRTEVVNRLKRIKKYVDDGRPPRAVRKSLGAFYRAYNLAIKDYKRALANKSYNKLEVEVAKRNINSEVSRRLKRINDVINRKTKYKKLALRNEINSQLRFFKKKAASPIIKTRVALNRVSGVVKEKIVSVKEKVNAPFVKRGILRRGVGNVLVKETVIGTRPVRKAFGGFIKSQRLLAKRLNKLDASIGKKLYAVETFGASKLSNVDRLVKRPFRKLAGDYIKTTLTYRILGVPRSQWIARYVSTRLSKIVKESDFFKKTVQKFAKRKTSAILLRYRLLSFLKEINAAQLNRSVRVRNDLIRRIIGKYTKEPNLRVGLEKELKLGIDAASLRRSLKQHELSQYRRFSEPSGGKAREVQVFKEESLGSGGGRSLSELYGRARPVGRLIEEEIIEVPSRAFLASQGFPVNILPKGALYEYQGRGIIPEQKINANLRLGARPLEVARANEITAASPKISEILRERPIVVGGVRGAERLGEKIRETQAVREQNRLRALLRLRGREGTQARRFKVSQSTKGFEGARALRFRKGAFHVYIRRGGKAVRFTKRPLVQKQALAFGNRLVDNSVAASFFLRKSPQKPVRASVGSIDFRKYRFPVSKSRLAPNSLVEKTVFRIDTRGEKRGLRAARVARGFTGRLKGLVNPNVFEAKRLREVRVI